MNNPYLIDVAGYIIDLRKVIFVGPLFNSDPGTNHKLFGQPKAYQIFTTAPAMIAVQEKEFSRALFVQAWDNAVRMDEGLILPDDAGGASSIEEDIQ